MAYLLYLPVNNQLHTVLTLYVHSVANVALSHLKQVLAEVKHGFFF